MPGQRYVNFGGVRTREPTAPIPPIVAAVTRQRRIDRWRFRIIYRASWLILIGLIVGGLLAANKINLVFLGEHQAYILAGIPITITVSAASITIAIVLATLGALGRLSTQPALYGIASFYVSIVRGTPLIVQILFLYLALPQIWEGFAAIPIPVLGIFALGFNYGAYMTEVFRAGIQAIPRGQLEAATALGMNSAMRLRRIVIPQAIRIVTPAIGNEFISMIKDSALVSLLGVQELLWRAQRIGTASFRSLETLLLAAVVYWTLTAAFSLLQDRLEKRMAVSDRRL